mmetsp:Transcript_31685/g.64488  ORF Transcript_31685/g.64488 Transcript_31685/m.64488 type:complete len:311 (+) Transcript_31685:144-1076(+)
MARGSESKQRRKAARAEQRAKAAEAEGDLNEFDAPIEEDTSGDDDPAMPMPPGQKQAADDAAAEAAAAAASARKKQKKKKRTTSQQQQQQRHAVQPVKKEEGIKTLPLVFLFLLTATTVLPAMFYVSDKFGAIIQKNHIMGSIGHRLGIGPSPKKRVVSFYEKHDPDKLDEVPNILSKYYGDYPKLVKRLERKYGDYGYFLNWEKDEAPMTLAFDKLETTRTYLFEQWNRYAPQFAKTATRNMKHNFTFLYKKGRKVFVKQIWPHLEPLFGVPDEKAARAQKRKDAAAAASAKPGRRKANTQYRDDVEED